MDSFRLNIYFVARYSTKYMKNVFLEFFNHLSGFKGLDFNLSNVENKMQVNVGDTEQTS